MLLQSKLTKTVDKSYQKSQKKLPKLLKQLEQLHFVRDIFPVCLSAIPNKITCSQFHVESTQIPQLDELKDPVTKICCVFRPAFGCWAHQKLVETFFSAVFQPSILIQFQFDLVNKRTGNIKKIEQNSTIKASCQVLSSPVPA